MTRALQLTGPVIPETKLHKQITDAMRLEICREGHVSPKGVCWFSIDMANYGGIPGTRVARGICAGVPDVIVLFRGDAHWIEIKTDAGVLSDDQREVCASLLLSGCRYAVARDADEVLACIDAWQIPRKKLIRLATRVAA